MNSPRTGGSLRHLRQSNSLHVLDLLASQGPMHRAEMARRANISRTTVTTITRDLMERGVLVELSERADGGHEVDGRAGDQLAFNPDAGWIAGMSQVLDRICVRITDLMGQEVGSADGPVGAKDDWTVRAAAAVELLDRALSNAGGERSDLLGVGIGLPGQINPVDGIVHGALADQPWHGINAREEMGRRLGVPVFIENNVRLETIAEAKWGAGRGIRDLMYVNMSSGIATGFLFGGELYRGSVGGAGELGHVSIDVNGPACRCGNRGCLVLVAGAPAILSRLVPTLGPSATMNDVLAANAAGDRPAQNVLAEAGTMVGRLLASMCNLLNPQRIVVGGQTSLAGAVVLDPLRESITRYALTPSAALEVVASDLGGGPEAGAAGGTALALSKLTTSPEMLSRLLGGPAAAPRSGRRPAPVAN
ncbi:putative NBD/HSP70 family sugar kinase [Arthrobacter pascens]|uniref:ROK family transcriptional regulator n=1 Tax=Arthrobacter pascens TaxID=1677 RepID=UPI00278FE16D|nr:ROK family transcriptional regulator [Arthrobacter pascens]MDQ0680661.1 putative NBD/HSP70 family sugar kinase [Arthrobacter pascens]